MSINLKKEEKVNVIENPCNAPLEALEKHMHDAEADALKEAAENKPKRRRLTDEERAQKEAEKQAKAEAKAEKQAEAEAKRVEKQARFDGDISTADIYGKERELLLPMFIKEYGDKKIAAVVLEKMLAGIVGNVVNKAESILKEKCANSYANSDTWLLFDYINNTASFGIGDVEKDLIDFYSNTEENVKALLGHSNAHIRENAAYSFYNFIPYYYMANTDGIVAQLEALINAGVHTIVADDFSKSERKALKLAGFVEADDEYNLPERKYAGLDNTYSEVIDAVMYVYEG